jgi:hypothetical protein
VPGIGTSRAQRKNARYCRDRDGPDNVMPKPTGIAST